MVTTSSFDGLAFTAVKVRFAGPTDTRGARWIATLHRDNGDRIRVVRPYDYARHGGARNARPAAVVCFTKARAAINEPTNPDEWVIVPAEFGPDAYVFTFVPAEYLHAA